MIMTRRRSLLARFSIFDLIVLSLMACLGIATKPLVVPLAHIITGPLFIPGGAVAGGFYMMWIVLGAGLVGKLGAATLIAAVQAIVVMAMGMLGTHGIMSIFTYILPGIAVDAVFVACRQRRFGLGCCFAAGIAANTSGALLVNFVFFRLPLVPLVLSLSAAALSGGVGGLIAHGVMSRFKDRMAW